MKKKISDGTIPIVHGWLLGDSAYGLRTNLMTPIPSLPTPGQRRYNRAFVMVRKNRMFIWHLERLLAIYGQNRGFPFLQSGKDL